MGFRIPREDRQRHLAYAQEILLFKHGKRFTIPRLMLTKLITICHRFKLSGAQHEFGEKNNFELTVQQRKKFSLF